MTRTSGGVTVAPPGWIVKYTGKLSPRGNGNGVRSLGMGVMPTRCTTRPQWSLITAPFGRMTFSPGIFGVVSTTGAVVGESMLTSWSVSSAGIQITYGSSVAGATDTSTWIGNTP